MARPTNCGDPGYLPALDGWRAVAVTLVLLTHLPGWPAGAWWAHLGELGVTVFFAVSGFVICSRLLVERDRTGTIDLRAFYRRRVVRILPAAYVYLAVVSLLGAAGWLVTPRTVDQFRSVSAIYVPSAEPPEMVSSVDPREVFTSVVFVRNYQSLTVGDGGWYTSHFWSLCIEEHFYLLFPALLLWSGRRAGWAVVGAAVVVIVWRGFALRYHLMPHYAGHAWAYRLTDLRLDALLWGCAAALIYAKWRPVGAWWAWLAVPLVPLAVVAYQRLPDGLRFTCVPLIVSPLVLVTVANPDRWLTKLLELGPVRWVGRLSYSLYLYQQLFLTLDAEPVDHPPLGAWQMWPLNIVSVFAAATASYYLIERPAVALGRRWASRPASLFLEPDLQRPEGEAGRAAGREQVVDETVQPAGVQEVEVELAVPAEVHQPGLSQLREVV
jgi:peptidoglycan/LPS O-acetylase OafA/YrhL